MSHAFSKKDVDEEIEDEESKQSDFSLTSFEVPDSERHRRNSSIAESSFYVQAQQFHKPSIDFGHGKKEMEVEYNDAEDNRFDRI